MSKLASRDLPHFLTSPLPASFHRIRLDTQIGSIRIHPLLIIMNVDCVQICRLSYPVDITCCMSHPNCCPLFAKARHRLCWTQRSSSTRLHTKIELVVTHLTWHTRAMVLRLFPKLTNQYEKCTWQRSERLITHVVTTKWMTCRLSHNDQT